MSDLLADLLRVKRELDALPPPLLGVRCHPVDALALRRATAPLTEWERMMAPALFISQRVQRGKAEMAYSRKVLDDWRRDDWRDELLRVLRRRLILSS